MYTRDIVVAIGCWSLVVTVAQSDSFSVFYIKDTPTRWWSWRTCGWSSLHWRWTETVHWASLGTLVGRRRRLVVRPRRPSTHRPARPVSPGVAHLLRPPERWRRRSDSSLRAPGRPCRRRRHRLTRRTVASWAYIRPYSTITLSRRQNRTAGRFFVVEIFFPPGWDVTLMMNAADRQP